MNQDITKQFFSSITITPSIRHFLIACLLIGFSNNGFGQKYITRTAHVHVKSTNRITDIEANNYQVASVFDIKTGNIDFIGLLKSFEFKLGAADQLFNSKMVDISAHPNIKFTGQIADIQKINFNQPGNYTITVNGVLYIWNEKRVTSAVGTLTINTDSSITANSDFVMMIEEGSVAKVNQLMKEKLPSVISVDTETLGISRKVEIALNMTYKAR